jgi:transposase-like protein
MKAKVEQPSDLNEKTEKVLQNEGLNKSEKIRQLFVLGLDFKDIAILVGVRYNFVYNVASVYGKIHKIELEATPVHEVNKEEIVDLWVKGKEVNEISKDLKVEYNHVFKVIKDLKERMVAAARAFMQSGGGGGNTIHHLTN